MLANASSHFRRSRLRREMRRLAFPAYNRVRYVRWVMTGRRIPPPHLVKQWTIASYAARFKTPLFVETGTYMGDMVHAMRSRFRNIYSIEIDGALAQAATARFARDPNVRIMQGDSSVTLEALLSVLDAPCLFWLDGHCSGGITAGAEGGSPIISELTAITSDSARHADVILIDDARLFTGSGGYPHLGEVERLARSQPILREYSVSDDIVRITPATRESRNPA